MSSDDDARIGPWPWLALGLAGLVLALAMAVPLPGGPSSVAARQAPAAARQAAAAAPQASASAPHDLAPAALQDLVERLAERLRSHPDDADGWAMLARTHAVGGRHAQAVQAFRRAAALRPDDAVLLADFADALAMTQQGRIGGEPMVLVRRALALAPSQPKALSLAGTEAFERQDWAAAADHWQRLQAAAGDDSPFVRQIGAGLAQARQRAAAAAR